MNMKCDFHTNKVEMKIGYTLCPWFQPVQLIIQILRGIGKGVGFGNGHHIGEECNTTPI